MTYIVLLCVCLAITIVLKLVFRTSLFTSFRKTLIFYMLVYITLVPLDIIGVHLKVW